MRNRRGTPLPRRNPHAVAPLLAGYRASDDLPMIHDPRDSISRDQVICP